MGSLFDVGHCRFQDADSVRLCRRGVVAVARSHRAVGARAVIADDENGVGMVLDFNMIEIPYKFKYVDYQ